MSQNGSRNVTGNQTKSASNSTKQPSTQKKSVDKNEDTQSKTKNIVVQKDPNRIVESLKPTQEQVRLASLLAVKGEDPLLTDKIKQVLEVYPSASQDEVLMLLHDKDYDVTRVLEYLLEGGEVNQDWKMAGMKPIKPKQNSPNQTLENTELEQTHKPNKENRKQKRENRTNEQQNRKPRSSDQRQIRQQSNGKDESVSNENNLEQKLQNLDLNSQEVDESDVRQQNRRGRGGARGGFNGRGRDRGRGGFRGINRATGRNDRREPRRNQNEFVNSALKNNLEHVETNEVDSNENLNIDSNEKPTNNLRDIGTWSNDQAGRGKKLNQRFNGQTNAQADEWDEEQEWQGDLSKTQIFTASTQKKDFSEAVQQPNDFPIGHFNAEEATQKIKKAVGIGGPTTTTTHVTVPQQISNSEINDQKAKQNLVKIPPSAKPLPPPTTKIPKSAVIMPDGSTSNSSNLDLQFGVDLDDQLVKTKIVSNHSQLQTVSPAQQKNLNQNYSKPPENIQNNLVQKSLQTQSQQVTKQFVNSLQSQQAQPQRQQYQNKEPSGQLLNVSPQTKPPNVNMQQQPQQQVLAQLQQIQTNQQSTVGSANVQNAKVTPSSNPNPTTPGAALPPPPGVGMVNPNNLVNPNNPYLIGLPFVGFDNQNFPYFDQTQIDTNNLIQMYTNHLANIPPPGVGGTGAASAPQYQMSDSKFQRNDVANSNTQLNSSNVTAQLNQQQQQQPPINLMPNLSNFPYYFPNYAFPNLYVPIPNGTQATPGAPNQPPFTNKPPYTQNFQNNQEEYSNYSTQPGSQMKNSTSNLSNVNDMANQSYSKNDKSTTPTYHAPTPPNNFQNPLLGQQAQHPNMGGNPPGQQMTYIASVIGGNMVHPGMQDNMNRNTGGGNLNKIQKPNYPSSWNQ